MAEPALKCTFKDSLKWPEDASIELIDGMVYMMSSPSISHQRLHRELSAQLESFLRGKPCEMFTFLNVRLFPQDDDLDTTFVIPDIFVVCDKSKLEDDRAVKGPPDFIIEILSESNRGHDLVTKKDWYERSGVKEYWVIDKIKHNRVYKYLLVNGKFFESIINLTETAIDIPLEVLPGCILSL